MSRQPRSDIGCDDMARSPRICIRMDETLKADVERCAGERGVAAAEFGKQAILRYMGWCAAQKEQEAKKKEREGGRKTGA